MSASIASGNPQLSVVVPVHNEEDNVAPLVGEIVAALRGVISFEIVYVDDTSRDATLQRLRDLQATTPELRVIRHLSNAGQSTAVRNGVKAARAPWIATLDGDGQNDPADIPKLLAQRDAAAADIKLFADAMTDNLMKRYGDALVNIEGKPRIRLKSETPLPGNRGVKVSTEVVREGGNPR